MSRNPPNALRLGDREFRKLAEYIEGTYGIRMPESKRVMLESRLHKRLRVLEMTDFREYLEYVFEDRGGDNELVNMVDAVTTNKTDFFREPDHFDWLASNLGRFYDDYGWGRRDNPLKIWSCAASTGEEPYTLAIVMEEFRRIQPRFEYTILASDLSAGVLEQARKAVYPEARIEPISPQLRSRYFLRSKDRSLALVRVKRDLRRRVRFVRLNLMDDDYGLRERFHVLFCRNVIIYFERPRQMQLLGTLVRYIESEGYLFLGHSETLAGANLPVYSVAPTIYQRSAHA